MEYLEEHLNNLKDKNEKFAEDRISKILLQVYKLTKNMETFTNYYRENRFGGVMVCLLPVHAGDPWIQLQSGQNKDFKISICPVSTKQAALRSRSKD